MSYADKTFLETCIQILTSGLTDYDYPVRPKWDDGTPAHTRKALYVVNRYNLAKEFPVMTLRKTGFKNAIDELLWIYQKKSNNVNDLGSHIWDSWADDTGSIGKAYGYQMAQIHHYTEGDFTQIDKVIYDLQHNPMSRSIMTNLYNHADLSEMHLRPCAYSMTFNVTTNFDGKFVLNGMLNQRSQDMLTANNWNTVQYAVLLHMIAQVCDMKVGKFTHVIADAHIYDRHIPIIVNMIRSAYELAYYYGEYDGSVVTYDTIRRTPCNTEGEANELFAKMYSEHVLDFIESPNSIRFFEKFPVDPPEFWMNPECTNFEDFTVDDFKLKNYESLPFEYKIPVAV